MSKPLVFALALAAVAAAALFQPALALSDSFYAAVPNGSQACMRLQLPDDSGWTGGGEVEYNITMEPDSARTWSDFSNQIVSTDENNTVMIPICFSKRTNTSCGERFGLKITSDKGTRTITGGACASSLSGFSTAPAATPAAASPAASVPASLNTNFGSFDLAFSSGVFNGQPGQPANITVFAGSYYPGMSLRITLSAGIQPVSPASQDVSFGSGGSRQLSFMVQTPQTGSIGLEMTGSVAGCTSSGCSVTRHATLFSSGSAPSQTGYRLGLFPETISAAPGQAVQFRLDITSYGFARNFSLSLTKPYGVDITLAENSVAVAAGQSRSVSMTAIPTAQESSYEFLVHVDSAENKKLVSGFINVNGMDAGAGRALDLVGATGNRSAMTQAQAAYNAFQSDQSLQSYGRLQDELDRLARESQPAAGNAVVPNNLSSQVIPDRPATPVAINTGQSGLDLFGKGMWMLIVIVAALLVVAAVFCMKKGKFGGGKKKTGLKEEFRYDEKSAF